MELRQLIAIHLVVNVRAILAHKDAVLDQEMCGSLLLAVDAVFVEGVALHLFLQKFLNLRIHRKVARFKEHVL